MLLSQSSEKLMIETTGNEPFPEYFHFLKGEYTFVI